MKGSPWEMDGLAGMMRSSVGSVGILGKYPLLSPWDNISWAVLLHLRFYISQTVNADMTQATASIHVPYFPDYIHFFS